MITIKKHISKRQFQFRADLILTPLLFDPSKPTGLILTYQQPYAGFFRHNENIADAMCRICSQRVNQTQAGNYSMYSNLKYQALNQEDPYKL